MRLASVTSCSAVSSGTLPISLRYIRTGSKLPPSLCVTRATIAPRRARRRRSRCRPIARATEPDRAAVALGRCSRCSAARRRGAGGRRVGGRTAGAALVFELQLFGDLVEHLDAARLEHLPELAQLVRVGLEIGERGEDLAGRDEAALANLVEHTDRGAARFRGRVRTARVRSPLRAQPSRSSSPRASCCSANSVVHVTNCSAERSAAFQCSSALAFASASSNDLISETRGSLSLSIDACNRLLDASTRFTTTRTTRSSAATPSSGSSTASRCSSAATSGRA